MGCAGNRSRSAGRLEQLDEVARGVFEQDLPAARSRNDVAAKVRACRLQTFDFRVDRPFHFGSMSVVPAIDVFNLTNTNTVQAINRNQAATNANTVSGIIAPRVMRFGVNFRW